MTLKSAVLALAAIGGVALASGEALAAMPNGIPQADKIASGPAADVDQVRWVCNPWGPLLLASELLRRLRLLRRPATLLRPAPVGLGPSPPPLAPLVNDKGAARPLFF
ncbi:hypothetical protein ABH991_006773 [Bradyrhizobium ottawaense]